MFRSRNKKNRVGVVFDISSGSVAAAIVVSRDEEKFPEIVWSYREYILKPNRNEDLEKSLKSTILNTVLELGSAGAKSLRQKYPKLSPELVQVSFSAPFSHTIKRTVKVKSDKPFKVSNSLIKELEKKARKEAEKQINPENVSKIMHLNLLSEATVDIKVNEYDVNFPYKGTASSISLSQLVSFAETNLVREVEVNLQKIFTTAKTDLDSFLSLYSRAIIDLVPTISNACLISITAEATEAISIEGRVPSSSQHIPYGQYSLAKDVSEAIGIPFSDALIFLKESDVDLKLKLSKAKLDILEKVLEDYENMLVGLFEKLGNSFSLPKSIYLHVDRNMENFFMKILRKSIKRVSSSNPKIYAITTEFFDFGHNTDSRIRCSAYVFHKKLYEDDIAETAYLV